jgi:hypothetical protein
MANRRLFPRLKESQVRGLSTPAALAAGRRARQSGNIAQCMLSTREPLLLASVQDEAGRLCHVSVRHLAGDEFGARCDCGDSGLCGHAMALLLAWAHDSHDFTHAELPLPAEPNVPGTRQAWQETLRTSNLTLLRAIARRHDLALHGAEREAVLTQVLDLLADPHHAQRAVDALSEKQRRLLQMLYVLNDGSTGTSSAELQDALAWQGVSAVEDELRELRDWGLVVALPSPWQQTDLYGLAPGVVSIIPAFGLHDSTGAEAVDVFAGNLASLCIPDEDHYLPELMLLAQHVQLTQRPTPPEPAQAQTIQTLRQWPYVVAELVKLQVNPGWSHQIDSTLTVPVPEPRLDAGSLEQMRALCRDDTLSDLLGRLLEGPFPNSDGPPDIRQVFEAWRALTTWTELWPAQQRNGLRVGRMVMGSQLTYAGWLQQLARGRRFVTRVLSLLPASTWFDFGSLLSYIREFRSEFLHDHASLVSEPPSWWLEWRGKIADPGNLEAWQASYGMFVAEVLRGPLCWLGAAEVAHAPVEDAGPDLAAPTCSTVRAFRITPLGLALLRGVELPPSTQDEQPLQLRADLSARLPLGRRNLSAYSLLERSARFERVHDRVAVYQFDIHRAHAAFANGYTGQEILAELERLSPSPAPDKVREQWLEWWRSYSQTRWYEGLTLVELADDYILQELLTQTDLRDHLLFTFGPRLVVVRPDSADAFARQLVKKGYTPRIA